MQTHKLIFETIKLYKGSDAPLYKQLDIVLRNAILSNELSAHTCLPATRAFAKILGVSRITVQETYSQLISEGYLYTVVGSGTFVTPLAINELWPVRNEQKVQINKKLTQRLSKRGKKISSTSAATRLNSIGYFRPGTPAIDLFPKKIWTSLWNKHIRLNCDKFLGYNDPHGYHPLRKAVADYLSYARGVDCNEEKVVITTGAQQGFIMTSLALLNSGDTIWFEEPGHTAGRDIFTASGLKIVNAPLDEHGLNIIAAKRKHPKPKLIFVTPSHQHPTGIAMPVSRRLELLTFAKKANAWILEDDYDSEFRYSGRPITSMQGLDNKNTVIYIGSFSKVLTPSIRLGYMVLPTALVDAFTSVQVLLCQSIPILPQLIMTDFITEGYFTSHLRKMRIAYKERRDTLCSLVERELGNLIQFKKPDVGMHLILNLPFGFCDKKICKTLWKQNIEALPLSMYYAGRSTKSGLVLGFTNITPKQMEPYVKRIATILTQEASTHSK